MGRKLDSDIWFKGVWPPFPVAGIRVGWGEAEEGPEQERKREEEQKREEKGMSACQRKHCQMVLVPLH